MTKAYFVQRDRYLRYDMEADRVDEGFPKPLEEGWSGLGATGFDMVDTALELGANPAYLFRRGSYVRVDQRAGAVDGEVTTITDGWPGLAAAGFDEGLDASLSWPNGKAYFFRGASYLRYDIATDAADSGYPLPIVGNWPGFEQAGFDDRIDAALNWGNGKAYFFRGGEYLRYDIGAGNVDPGYPRQIAGFWPGFEETGFAARVDAAWADLQQRSSESRSVDLR